MSCYALQVVVFYILYFISKIVMLANKPVLTFLLMLFISYILLYQFNDNHEYILNPTKPAILLIFVTYSYIKKSYIFFTNNVISISGCEITRLDILFYKSEKN